MNPETHMMRWDPQQFALDCVGAVARLVSWPVAAFPAPSSLHSDQLMHIAEQALEVR